MYSGSLMKVGSDRFMVSATTYRKNPLKTFREDLNSPNLPSYHRNKVRLQLLLQLELHTVINQDPVIAYGVLIYNWWRRGSSNP